MNLQTDTFKVLFIGDVVGKVGRNLIKNHIKEIKDSVSPQFTIINVENIAGGFGINKKTYLEIEPYADCFTGGNHIFDRKEAFGEIDAMSKLIRPHNMPVTLPGCGFRIFSVFNISVCVVNLLGRIFMDPVDNPFTSMENLLHNNCVSDSDIRIVDFHAEATSEKKAFGLCFDGVVNATIGTHTHIQTSDEQILPNGSAYITDVGMSGCHGGVIGFNKDEVIYRFKNYVSKKTTLCDVNKRINGCVVEIDKTTKKTIGILRMDIFFND